MQYIPHDRRANIYLNALEEAPKRHKGYESSVHQLNHGQVNKFFEKMEENRAVPTSLDERLAAIGMKLSEAHLEKRKKEAVSLKSEYLELAQSHPAAQTLAKVPDIIEEHSVPGYDYRNWKGTTKGLNFGVIQASLDDNAVVGIIGDWGTGDPDAQAVLQELKDDHSPDLIIHLGDIYRSCRYDQDVMPNFIDIINNVYPKDSNGNPMRPPILTIAGNHDYMSKGGKGFFQLIDSVNNHCPQWQQEASYFCLRTASNKWQILGADTGINDPSYNNPDEHPGLEKDECTWHYDKMKNFASKGQGRTIFLTHHPLFSATHSLDNGQYLNDNLANNLDGYLTGGSTQAGEIRLWLWGHNHWFIPYVNTAKVIGATLDKGRLIGGSARHDLHSSSEIVNSGRHVINYNKNGNQVPLVPDSNNGLPNHTYAVMKFSDADVEVTHYQRPSWHYGANNPVKDLPASQHKVLLREYILDSKPMEKYTVG